MKRKKSRRKRRRGSCKWAGFSRRTLSDEICNDGSHYITIAVSWE